jgi:hypothetical protein
MEGMSRPIALLLCAGLLAALPAAAPAKGPLPEPDDGPDPRGLTLTGIGVAPVRAPAQLSQESIERAVAAARPLALERAVRRARERAAVLAAAAGLTLGSLVAVTERQQAFEQGFADTRTRYCPRPRTGMRRDGRGPACRVPEQTIATVAVTFATAQTDAAQPSGLAITVHGGGDAPVRPRDRRSSPSILRALVAARQAALPAAYAAARAALPAAAASAGMAPGPLFSIAEVRRSFEDFFLGSFGPGRFCGTVRTPVVRRDPRTGRRRVVRRVARRACRFSGHATLGLRVTYLPEVSAG